MNHAQTLSQELVRKAKVAAAICVAGEIFQQAMKRPASPAKLLRTQMAGDAMNKTMPGNEIARMYPNKPEDQSDVEFLLGKLEHIALVPPEAWVARKVRPVEWAEYTRVLRGMECYLMKGHTNAPLSKVEQGDVSGMLQFISPMLVHVKDAAVREVLSQASV